MFRQYTGSRPAWSAWLQSESLAMSKDPVRRLDDARTTGRSKQGHQRLLGRPLNAFEFVSRRAVCMRQVVARRVSLVDSRTMAHALALPLTTELSRLTGEGY